MQTYTTARTTLAPLHRKHLQLSLPPLTLQGAHLLLHLQDALQARGYPGIQMQVLALQACFLPAGQGPAHFPPPPPMRSRQSLIIALAVLVPVLTTMTLALAVVLWMSGPRRRPLIPFKRLAKRSFGTSVSTSSHAPLRRWGLGIMYTRAASSAPAASAGLCGRLGGLWTNNMWLSAVQVARLLPGSLLPAEIGVAQAKDLT